MQLNIGEINMLWDVVATGTQEVTERKAWAEKYRKLFRCRHSSCSKSLKGENLFV